MGIGILMLLLINAMHGLYDDGRDWSRTQIKLDNLAMEVGEEDSSILDMLRIKNALLKAAELAHHPLHACAQSPWPPTAAACAGPDKIAEAGIRMLVQSAEMEAKMRWMKNGAQAWTTLRGIGTYGGIIKRRTSVPAETETCSYCQLKNRFRLTEKNVHHHLSTLEKQRPLQVGVGLVGDSLTQTKKWNFKLDPGEKGK